MMLFPRAQHEHETLRIWYTPGNVYKIVCERLDGVNHWRLSECQAGVWRTILKGTGEVAQEMIMQATGCEFYSRGDHPSPESAEPYRDPRDQFADSGNEELFGNLDAAERARRE